MALTSLALLFLATTAGSVVPPTLIPVLSPGLQILGCASPAEGIFDPSLAATSNPEYPYVLSYSTVGATANVSTRISVYDTKLSGFVCIAPVNTATSGTYPCAGGTPCTATLVHEVSSLVLDPMDPSRTVKIFTVSYLVLEDPPNTLRYDIGYISLHTAANVSGPFTSTPLLGWEGASPFSSTGVSMVLTTLTPLSDCLFFSEPGATLSPQGYILLALTCISPPREAGGEAYIRVVLLKSVDHAVSWEYVGVLVDGGEASSLGYTVPQLSAPDLFFVGDTAHLIITPTTALWDGFQGYNGCLVLQLNATLDGVVRGGDGIPIVFTNLTTDGQSFNGACTGVSSPVAPEVGGFFLSVLTPQSLFHIVQTKIPVA